MAIWGDRCGRIGFLRSFTMSATYIPSETEFDELLSSESVFVVDCTAAWCGPCKLIAPLIDQLADEYRDRVKVFKLDLDSNRAIANRYSIRSIPAVMFFVNGEVAESIVGAKTYEDYRAACDKYLA